jgi:4'-phosphopantetheinyl transferase
VSTENIPRLSDHEHLGAAADFWLFNGKNLQQSDLQSLTARLSPSEAQRFAHFTRTMRRRQFLLGRVLLRFAVATITGMTSDDFSVVEKCGAGPQLVFNDRSYPAPKFSLSHSGEWNACVVSTTAALGIDIELNRPNRDFDDICAVAFESRDRVWLRSQPRTERIAAFYSVWCMKEALYKLQCNLGLNSGDARLLGNETADDSFGPAVYPYKLLLEELGLTGIVFSNQRLSTIRRIILT